jgi:hypothetical protein
VARTETADPFREEVVSLLLITVTGQGDARSWCRGLRGPILGACVALPDRDEPLQNALRHRTRRPQEVQAMVEPPEPTRRTEPIWLEPYRYTRQLRQLSLAPVSVV